MKNYIKPTLELIDSKVESLLAVISGGDGGGSHDANAKKMGGLFDDENLDNNVPSSAEGL